MTKRWMLRLLVLPLAAALGVAALPAVQADGLPGDAEIEARWVALQGTPGDLGAKLPPPNDTPRDVKDTQNAVLGRVQDFTGGSIFWSSTTAAWEVTGPIRDAYLAAGGASGSIGFPTRAPETLAPDGVQQVFSGGRFYWSAATGAQVLQGAVLAKYLAAGGPTSALKLPTTGEVAVTGGSRVIFAGGHIYRSAAGGARIVSGAILAKYLASGGPAGRLRMPTSDEVAVPRGRSAIFQGGRIYWSSATGAHTVWGGNLTKYLAIGASGSYLGLPITDEYVVSDTTRNKFQYGWIIWYPGKGPLVLGVWRPSVKTVTAAEIPYTYRSGCPVGPSSLRRVKMPYYNWSGVPKLGDLIVRTSSADDMQRVFKRAFDVRFNIRQIRPVDVWKGIDIDAMAADNTSAFNCRKVTGNPYRLSQHSYGNAIDINTFENPYVTATRVYPAGSETYLNRRNVRKGMIVSTGPIARGMRAEAWPWGARWAHPDYQHFSSNGG